MSIEEQPLLLSTRHADRRLLAILILQEKVPENRQARYAQGVVAPALAIVLNAHKSNGVTSGQISELEKLESTAYGLAS